MFTIEHRHTGTHRSRQGPSYTRLVAYPRDEIDRVRERTDLVELAAEITKVKRNRTIGDGRLPLSSGEDSVAVDRRRSRVVPLLRLRQERRCVPLDPGDPDRRLSGVRRVAGAPGRRDAH